MKGFLIFMVLLVGGSVYVLTHINEIGQQFIEDVEKQEGTIDLSAARANPPAFIAKYQPLLERRNQIAKYIQIFGDDEIMMTLATKTRELYDDSPLGTDPVYAEILFRQAATYEDRNNPGAAMMANEIYRHYMTQFPEGKNFAECSSGVSRLSVKYNLK